MQLGGGSDYVFPQHVPNLKYELKNNMDEREHALLMFDLVRIELKKIFIVNTGIWLSTRIWLKSVVEFC